MKDRSADVYISTFVTLVAATVAVMLRFAARHITKVNLGYDDLSVIIALVWAIAYSAVVLLWTAHWGLGKPPGSLIDKTIDEILTKSRMLLFFAELTYAFSIAFSKLAILAFYWRMFKITNIRIPILILVGLAVLWLVLRTFLVIFHCAPVQAFWDTSIEGATCVVNQSAFFFGTVMAHFIIDIAILVLPVVQVSRLQLRYGQKVAVITLFMFGIFVCVASVCLLVESLGFDLHTSDMAYSIVMIVVWSTVEVNLAIISACLPMLRPIVRCFLPAASILSGGYAKPPCWPKTAIKLKTLKTRIEDKESSSTQHLTGIAKDASDFIGNELPGHHTAISGPSPDYSPSCDIVPAGGIQVQREMTMVVEQT